MLNYNRILPALLLAIVMLVGCREPIGLPNNDVHVASICTTFCVVDYTSGLTGSVKHYMDGQTPEGWYSRDTPYIKWGYTDSSGHPWPEQYGFAVFNVPEFQSPNEIPICTLYYYVRAYNGSLNLVFNYLPDIQLWPGSDAVLFKAIDTSTSTLTTDGAPTSTGWRKKALTDQGSGILATIGAAGGTDAFYTGWKYDNTPQSGWYTEVYGTDDAVSPYIKVVYDNGQ